MARDHRRITITGPPPWCLWCLRWWLANAGEAASTAANNKTRIFFIFAPVLALKTPPGSKSCGPTGCLNAPRYKHSGVHRHTAARRTPRSSGCRPPACRTLTNTRCGPKLGISQSQSRQVSFRLVQVLPYPVQELLRMGLQGLCRQSRTDRDYFD